MPNRQTVCLLNTTRPERNAAPDRSERFHDIRPDIPGVSNGTPGSRCCPVRLSTYREEVAPMRSQTPAGRGKPAACGGAVQDDKESQFRNYGQHPYTASRGRENGAPTRTSAGQGSSRQGYCKSRRRGSQGREIRAASTRSKTSGLNPVRSQVRLSGISVDRPDRYAASSAKHGELLRTETNRFAQVSTFNTRAPDRSPTEICSAQVRATQVGSNLASEVIAEP